MTNRVGIEYEMYVARRDVDIPKLGVHISKGEVVYLGSVSSPRLRWVKTLDGEVTFGGERIADAVNQGHLRPRLRDDDWNGPLVMG